MNELIQTILNKCLKDISELQDEVKELKKSNTTTKKVWNVDPNKPSTQAQRDAVAIRGGKIWDGMTHQDITNQFNEINNKKSETPNKDIEKRIESPEIEKAISEGTNQSENKESNSKFPDY